MLNAIYVSRAHGRVAEEQGPREPLPNSSQVAQPMQLDLRWWACLNYFLGSIQLTPTRSRTIHDLYLVRPFNYLVPKQVLTSKLSNLVFYNVFCACSNACLQQPIIPYSQWTEDCPGNSQVTDDYPFSNKSDRGGGMGVDIPDWANAQLSGGDFNPVAVFSGTSRFYLLSFLAGML